MRSLILFPALALASGICSISIDGDDEELGGAGGADSVQQSGEASASDEPAVDVEGGAGESADLDGDGESGDEPDGEEGDGEEND